MAINQNTPYGESMKIYEIIEVLKEVENLHLANPQISSACSSAQNMTTAKNLLDTAIDTVANNTFNSKTKNQGVERSTIEDKMTRQIKHNNKMCTLNIWRSYIINWLISANKNPIKKYLLQPNVTTRYSASDMIAIQNW